MEIISSSSERYFHVVAFRKVGRWLRSSLAVSFLIAAQYHLTGINMSKQQKRSKKKSIIITATAVIGIALLSTGGVFGLKAYRHYQANKIYSVGKAMPYPSFSVEVTKAEIKPVDISNTIKAAQKYGGLNNNENCDNFSKAATMTTLGFGSNSQTLPDGPSDYNLCIRRNESRQAITKYTEANRQLVINYKINADTTIDTSQVKVKLIPDSGRNLSNQYSPIYCNEFTDPSAYDLNGIRYSSSAPCNDNNTTYFQSDIGENISKGLTRTGYLYTDVRNNENSVDFILSYSHAGKTDTRTTRIELAKK